MSEQARNRCGKECLSLTVWVPHAVSSKVVFGDHWLLLKRLAPPVTSWSLQAGWMWGIWRKCKLHCSWWIGLSRPLSRAVHMPFSSMKLEGTKWLPGAKCQVPTACIISSWETTCQGWLLAEILLQGIFKILQTRATEHDHHYEIICSALMNWGDPAEWFPPLFFW